MAKKDDEIKTNKNALLMFRRIIKIDYLLSNDAYPSVKEMEADDEINCSRATVMRVIDFMRYEMNAPIAYDRERGGYFYTNKTFRLPMQFMSEKEMEAINFLDHYIVNMHGSPIYEPVCTVLDMLKNSALRNPHEKPYDINGDRPDFNFNDSPDHNWLDDRLIVFVDEVDDEKAKINYGLDEADWDNLMKAMKENRVITINHYWPNKRALALRGHKPRTYKVEPFQILCDDNDWYLWALQKGEGKDRDRFRLYHFKKLDTVKITREKFTLPAKYKYLDVHSKECWWDDIWGIMPDERITMSFLVSADFKSKIDEDFIKRTRAFKSEEKPDGSLEVSFRLTPRPVGCTYNYDRTRSFYFPKEVWGDNVTPLEPKELVEAWGKSEPKIRVITQIT